jgi:hypothetical protein
MKTVRFLLASLSLVVIVTGSAWSQEESQISSATFGDLVTRKH